MRKIPGFTAEQSFRSESLYRVLGQVEADNSESVVPQAVAGSRLSTGVTIDIEPEQCVLRCRWHCTRYFCWPTDCYWSCF